MIDIRNDRSENVKYDYPDFSVYIRRGLLSTFPNYTADSHWHDDIELIAILSGQMQYHVNGENVLLREGEGILVNARQFHYGFSQTQSECDYICILFHPLLLCTTESFQAKFVAPILSSGISYLQLLPSVSWHNNILQHIRSIYLNANAASSPLFIQGQLLLLWNEVIANTKITASQDSGDHSLTTIKSMTAYIHQNYKNRMTLSQIAAAGHVSKRTCGMLFLKYLNRTPIDYLNNYRLRKGIELMKTSDMTMTQIGLEVGFSGASYFSETFRKHFGQSPTAYKRHISGKND